jgi:hypothetical protein
VEKQHLPHMYHHFLKLPPHLDSLPEFPSKMCKVNKCGTYISTSQTCHYLVMSTKSNLNHIRSPLTPIPFVISGIHLNPSASTVGVS